MSVIENANIYRITGGQAMQVVEDRLVAKDRFWKHVAKMQRRYGARRSKRVLVKGGVIAGLTFAEHPGNWWKQDKDYDGFYFPKRNCKRGKDAAADLRSVQDMDKGEITKRFIGDSMIITSRRPVGGSPFSMIIASAHLCQVGDDWYVLIDREAKTEPIVDGLEQVKTSEFYAAMEAAGVGGAA